MDGRPGMAVLLPGKVAVVTGGEGGDVDRRVLG
jgi:hypothetical protein